MSLVSLEKPSKFARRKEEICQNVKYTMGIEKSAMIKKMYFFPEPVNGSAISDMGCKRQQHRKSIDSNSTLMNEYRRQVF